MQLALITEGALLALALLLGWWLRVAEPGWFHVDLRLTILAVAATLPLWVAMYALNRWPIGPLARLRKIVDELLIPLFRNCTLLDLAVISLLAGIGEEALFRGVLQVVATRWLGELAGLVAASILFGLAHSITTTYAVLAALIGLYLGWLFALEGNLLLVMAIHALYDFGALIYLVRWQRAPPGSQLPGEA